MAKRQLARYCFIGDRRGDPLPKPETLRVFYITSPVANEDEAWREFTGYAKAMGRNYVVRLVLRIAEEQKCYVCIIPEHPTLSVDRCDSPI